MKNNFASFFEEYLKNLNDVFLRFTLENTIIKESNNHYVLHLTFGQMAHKTYLQTLLMNTGQNRKEILSNCHNNVHKTLLTENALSKF